MKVILDKKDNFIDVTSDLDKELTKMILKLPKDKNGYLIVSLTINEEQVDKLINALMKSKADIWQKKAE